MKKKRMKPVYIGVLLACIAIGLGAIAMVRGSIKINTKVLDEEGFSITPEYFSELPAKPDNFDTIQQWRKAGVIEDDPVRVDDKYWKQLEWFPLPEKFMESVENVANSPYVPWWCVGIYDAQMVSRIENIMMSDNNTKFTQRFWIRTIPGMLANIGGRLRTSYPYQKEMIGNRQYGTQDMIVSQDPELTKQYVKIKVIKICSDSKNCEDTDTFLLGKTLPMLDYDYVKEVWFEVEIDRDTPSGWYVVNLEVVAPDKRFTSDMLWKYMDMDEGYVDPNLGASCGVPSFSFFVEVK